MHLNNKTCFIACCVIVLKHSGIVLTVYSILCRMCLFLVYFDYYPDMVR